MQPIDLLIYVSYALTFVAYIVSDILWLRSVAIISEVIMIVYGVLLPSSPMWVANSIFLVINGIQVIRILIERKPVILPDELEEVYNKVFQMMSKREFKEFWNLGQSQLVRDTQLCERGEVLEDIMLLVDGTVEILSNGKHITNLDKGNFVAEMSFLTGEPASADVVAKGIVNYMSWSQEKLYSLEERNTNLYIKIHLILGKDLAYKLKRRNVGD